MSADQDEAACNETSHQNLHCLHFWLKPLFAIMDMSKCRDDSVNLRNLGVKALSIIISKHFHHNILYFLRLK